jgi:5-methyltetrahydropteroyltriglutamate--homocysteine methyltransferase
MSLPTGLYRADHVGSFLRSPAIKEAREKNAGGDLPAGPLRKVEDEEIANLIDQELQNGIRSITDGEFRRAYFHLDFLKQVSAVDVVGIYKSTSKGSDRFGPPRLVVTGKLKHDKPIQLEDYKFLASSLEKSGVSNATVKVCIPSPTMLHFRGGRASIDMESYPDLDPFFDDLAKVYQEEIQSLYDAGCRFIQLDDTNLAYLCDPKMRADVEARNEDPVALTKKYAELINAALPKKPADLKVGIHLCRGNYRSQWFASGGYEPVAEVLFRDLNVDAYFLEYDDARSGDFAPLRFLPENKFVVLGLMTSKKPELDDKAQIIQRLHEAAKFCPKGLDQLCLSHQCGFSSTQEGNDLSTEEQWAKVRLEVEIAKEVWSDA